MTQTIPVTVPLTRAAFEKALDSGELYVAINNGRWWKARRNGKTITWKRDLDRFRIPFKYGLKNCGSVSETDLRDGIFPDQFFRHVDDVPAGVR